MTPDEYIEAGGESIMRPLSPLARALEAASPEEVALLMLALARYAALPEEDAV